MRFSKYLTGCNRVSGDSPGLSATEVSLECSTPGSTNDALMGSSSSPPPECSGLVQSFTRGTAPEFENGMLPSSKMKIKLRQILFTRIPPQLAELPNTNFLGIAKGAFSCSQRDQDPTNSSIRCQVPHQHFNELVNMFTNCAPGD